MASNWLARALAAVLFFVFTLTLCPAAEWADDGDNLWPDSGNLYVIGNTWLWDVVSDGGGGGLVFYINSDAAPGSDYVPLVFASIDRHGIATASWVLSQQASYATITSDVNGGALIGYAEGKLGANGYTMYAQRFSPTNGFMWGDGFNLGRQVSTSFGQHQGFSLVYAPILASDGIGGVYISWGDRLAYVAPDGTLAAPGLDGIEFVTAGPGVTRAFDLRLAADGTGGPNPSPPPVDLPGGTFAAWNDPDGPGFIAQHIRNALDLEWGPNGLLLDPGAQAVSSITLDGASGGFIVGWWEDPASSVYVQKYSSDGVAQWVHTGVFVASGITHGGSTQVLSDGAGGAFVTWETDAGTFMQRIAANGVILWPADALLGTDQYVPRAMVADGSGGVLMTFAEMAFSDDIKAARFTADGYRLYSRWVRQDGSSPADPGFAQRQPSIAFDGSGPDPKGAVIVWGQDDGEGFPSGIYGQKIAVVDYAVPANDNCSGAIPVTVGDYSGTLIKATNDGSVNCVGDTGEPDVWYSFVSPGEGRLEVTTCGTNDRGEIDADMDTVVSLHAGCTGTGANELDCNDDWHNSSLPTACAAMDQGATRDSAVSRFMAADERILIRVSRFSNTIGGHFTLRVNFVGDFDGDGHLDDVDNCMYFANAPQRDTDRDGFGNICDADFNDDCITNFIDLSRLADLFFVNDSSPDWDPDLDLNNDGIINFIDLAVMKALFFATPGPSGAPNICEAYCGLRDTGLDPSHHFRVPMFVQGSMSDPPWVATPPFSLINFGEGVYRAQAPVAIAALHELKIADAGWTREYDAPTQLVLGEPGLLYGGSPDGSPNVTLPVEAPGCYNFRVEVVDTDIPAAQVELTVNRKP